MLTPSFKAILLDIEGTVTPISFVKDVLFPFSIENVEHFLRENTKDQVRTDQALMNRLIYELVEIYNEETTQDTKEIRKIDTSNDNIDCIIRQLVPNIKKWIKLDKKLTPLKTLQGLIWEKGYADGRLRSYVYDDVVKTIFSPEFSASKIPIYIFSSGSVRAQQLLFAHTQHGDQTTKLTGYFDTAVGAKSEPGSYTKIAQTIGASAANILFLTDVEVEAFAALDVGFRVQIVVREGNAPLSDRAAQNFQQITSFNQIFE